MSDHDARFAAVLAGRANRIDWWNVWAEHNPYEWAMQAALYQVEPWGDYRDDLRAASQAVVSVVSQAAKEPSNEAVEAIFKAVMGYLVVNREPDREATMAEIAAMIGQ